MKLEAMLQTFARVARPIIRRRYQPGSCLASTRITIDVLRALGFVASPLAVMLYVGNPSFLDSLSEDDTYGASLEAEATHRPLVVEVGSKFGRGDLGGHLVAVADDRFLVDASFDQVHFPARGIIAPPVLVGRVSPELIAGRSAQRLDVNGLFVEYRRHRNASHFLRAPNWRASQDTRASVREILAAMDRGMDGAAGSAGPDGTALAAVG